MLPFCGYNMGDYFGHWLKLGKQADPQKLPRIYFVNWFRKDGRGRFLWPGFGENSRVLKWIVDRLDGRADAEETPIGRTPARGSLDLSGLNLDSADLDRLLEVDPAIWEEEAALIGEAYAALGERLPEALWAEHAALAARLRLALADDLLSPESLVAAIAGRAAFAVEPLGVGGLAREQAPAAEA
jgi:phosphoenolpyruvate carboxykinase (GTP)